MSIIRWILSALSILVILGFALQNQEQTVSVHILKWQSANLPLYIFMYLAFGAGMLLWVVVSSFNLIKLKTDVMRYQKENKRIREELDRLRNVSLDDEEIKQPRLPETASGAKDSTNNA